MIADMAIEIDAMQMLILNAASLAESGQAFHREAYLARSALRRKIHENRHRWCTDFGWSWFYQRTSGTNAGIET